jgi:hypothetical protein
LPPSKPELIDENRVQLIYAYIEGLFYDEALYDKQEQPNNKHAGTLGVYYQREKMMYK